MQIGSEVMKFEGLKQERETVNVPIPKEVYARGGKVGLDLGASQSPILSYTGSDIELLCSIG
jgi:hypothetical protein